MLDPAACLAAVILFGIVVGPLMAYSSWLGRGVKDEPIKKGKQR